MIAIHAQIHSTIQTSQYDMQRSLRDFIEWLVGALSYPTFVRGLLLDGMQPLIERFEVLSTLCCTICEVPRRAGNQKKAWLCDP